MSRNQEFYTVYCTREGSSKTSRVQEWTLATAVERACKMVDHVAKVNSDGKESAVKIEIEQNFVNSTRQPRLKFCDQVPLDNSRSKSKLYRTRRKYRAESVAARASQPSESVIDAKESDGVPTLQSVEAVPRAKKNTAPRKRKLPDQ